VRSASHHTGNCTNSLAPSVGTIQYRFHTKKSIVVNTPTHTDAGGNSRGTPDAAYQAKIDQMQKDLDALYQSKAALRLNIAEGKEQSSQTTNTKAKEEIPSRGERIKTPNAKKADRQQRSSKRWWRHWKRSMTSCNKKPFINIRARSLW
jgi:hypothetical protein